MPVISRFNGIFHFLMEKCLKVIWKIKNKSWFKSL